MIKIGLCIVFVLICAVPSQGQTEKQSDISKLLNLMGYRELFVQINTEALNQFKPIFPEIPEEFWTKFETERDLDEMILGIIPILAKYFTHDEIKQLMNFYITPIGKKLVSVQGELSKESMAFGAIPDYKTIMLPLLTFAGDGQEHSFKEAVGSLADEFGLSEAERKELLASGQTVFNNRVGWANTYMKKAGLIDSTKFGFFKISPRGVQVLENNPPEINKKFLMQFEGFVKFNNSGKAKNKDFDKGEDQNSDDQTPQEQIEEAYNKINDDLASNLLERIKDNSPEFFERLVVDVLVKMGYGGTHKDAGQAIGGTGDGGIDGIIKEDKLGLDTIYLQAKRWDGTVSKPEIQKFAGALQGQKAQKGVFITTSSFTKGAVEYVDSIDTRIILVDGNTLMQLMTDFNVGVSVVNSYEVKRIDVDYFLEE